MSQITSIKRVKNDSLQAEFIDEVEISERINALQLLNRGDDRFNPVRSPRHAWFPITLMSLEDLGISKEKMAEIAQLKQGEPAVAVNIQDPKIAGERLAIQVNESIYPFDPYQTQNVMKAAKQLPITAQVAKNKALAAGRNLAKYEGGVGYFLDKDGNHIFSKTTVTVASQVQHTVVKDAVFVPAQELSDFGATLAEPKEVKSSEYATKQF